MSLINEALKKAQSERTGDTADFSAPMPGGGRRTPARAPGLSVQTLVLLASGGIVLFVISVVGAVSWLNRPATPTATAAKPATVAAAPTTKTVETQPIIVLASLKPAPAADAGGAAKSEGAAATTMSAARSAPLSEMVGSGGLTLPPAVPRLPAPSLLRAADAVISPEPVAAAPTLSGGKFQEHIQAIVDGLRVSGIRADGKDSKVLLNERVYRVNDFVDRSNGLRLSKVTNEDLTFSTPDGTIYLKNF